MEHHREEVDQDVQAGGEEAEEGLWGTDRAGDVKGPEERVDEQLQEERDGGE